MVDFQKIDRAKGSGQHENHDQNDTINHSVNIVTLFEDEFRRFPSADELKKVENIFDDKKNKKFMDEILMYAISKEYYGNNETFPSKESLTEGKIIGYEKEKIDSLWNNVTGKYPNKDQLEAQINLLREIKNLNMENACVLNFENVIRKEVELSFLDDDGDLLRLQQRFNQGEENTGCILHCSFYNKGIISYSLIFESPKNCSYDEIFKEKYENGTFYKKFSEIMKNVLEKDPRVKFRSPIISLPSTSDVDPFSMGFNGEIQVDETRLREGELKNLVTDIYKKFTSQVLSAMQDLRQGK